MGCFGEKVTVREGFLEEVAHAQRLPDESWEETRSRRWDRQPEDGLRGFELCSVGRGHHQGGGPGLKVKLNM